MAEDGGASRAAATPGVAGARVAVVVKGYPRLSETFVTQEILGLEARGLDLEIWSLRRPTDAFAHPMHGAVRSTVRYLPEYLLREPWRVARGFAAALRRPGFPRLLRAFARDLRRDPTANRLRRLGQAAVLARELPGDVGWLYAHFLHTPGSVARYAALLTGRPWSASAHAKDIWTTPDWELREKLAEAEWAVTCTEGGRDRLAALAPPGAVVRHVPHGLDLAGFPPPPDRPARDGSDPLDPVRIVSVGRAVEKKGFDDLLRALAALPADLHWRFAHVGGGAGLHALQALAAELGVGDRVAFLGPKPRPDVVGLLREGDLFALPSRAGADGDRDGLPNVLMEAASQGLAIVATRFGGIPEFVRADQDGLLTEAGAWDALSNALNELARDPARRVALGRSALARLRERFGAAAGLDEIAGLLRGGSATARSKRP